MNENLFWTLIEDAHSEAGGSVEEQTRILIEKLAQYHEVDIATFHLIYAQHQNNAYTGSMWDVCSFITCGGGEQRFIDFRAWLIAQGRDIYNSAVENPDTLSRVIDPENREEIVTYEEFSYVASTAMQRRGVHNFYSGGICAGEPMGPQLDDANFKQRFPLLYHKLGECPKW